MSSPDDLRLNQEEADAARAHVEEARRTGRTLFMGIELLVDGGALVPRVETELLAKTALAHLARLPGTADGTVTVIDMCCGSGNLACAIATHEPRARVLAADLTESCVSLARRNVIHAGVSDRVSVFQGDLFTAFESLPGGLSSVTGLVALIVCNPPYISSARLAKDRASLLENEPAEAFDGGPYGLSIHQRVIRDAAPLLRADGLLMFEIGLGQERQVKVLFQRAGCYCEPSFPSDARGRPRVAVAAFQPSPTNS